MTDVLENEMVDETSGVISRLSLLKEEADLLGVQYPNNITATKLEERIEEHKRKQEELKKANAFKESLDENKDEIKFNNYKPSLVGKTRAEAFKQIRFKLIVNDPNLQEATGISVTAGNEIVGHVTRIIPTNVDAWHAEAIIVEHLKAQRFQQFKSKKYKDISYTDSEGAVLMPRFTVIELPPLTEEELAQLKNDQVRRNTGRAED